MKQKIKRMSFAFSPRHEALLISLSKDLGIPMTQTLQRALEVLEEREAKRRVEVKR